MKTSDYSDTYQDFRSEIIRLALAKRLVTSEERFCQEFGFSDFRKYHEYGYTPEEVLKEVFSWEVIK